MNVKAKGAQRFSGVPTTANAKGKGHPFTDAQVKAAVAHALAAGPDTSSRETAKIVDGLRAKALPRVVVETKVSEGGPPPSFPQITIPDGHGTTFELQPLPRPLPAGTKMAELWMSSDAGEKVTYFELFSGRTQSTRPARWKVGDDGRLDLAPGSRNCLILVNPPEAPK